MKRAEVPLELWLELSGEGDPEGGLPCDPAAATGLISATCQACSVRARAAPVVPASSSLRCLPEVSEGASVSIWISNWGCEKICPRANDLEGVISAFL